MLEHRLIEIDWPDFGVPAVPPRISRSDLAARLVAIRAGMDRRGLDALVLYGDREHSANLLWASGFDPRFEEALMVVRHEGPPLLVAGNECLSYTAASPAVAAGDIAVAHCASLSLLSQPRGSERLDTILARAVPAGGRIGAAGWKYWGADEVDDPAHALDLPSVIADLLRQIGEEVVNVGEMFMDPGHGLRCTVGPDDIARLEFANQMAAGAVRRIAFALREGMTDFEAVAEGRIGGLPLGCHVTFATAGMARHGLTGPVGEVIARGHPISFNVCHWGSNVCRAGWVAEGEDDLPATARGHLEDFVAPYLAAMSRWCAMMRPGVTGGAVQAAMDEALPGFGVTLNPGHLIGTDEWISSPILPGSELPLRSGMAMQSDVIPDHPAHGSTRMEDGYVIADADLTDALIEAHPAVATRILKRAEFMRDVIGLDVPGCLMPLADTCGIIAPFLLAPRKVVSLV
jgi:Xaa-Pro aminopeptidase